MGNTIVYESLTVPKWAIKDYCLMQMLIRIGEFTSHVGHVKHSTYRTPYFTVEAKLTCDKSRWVRKSKPLEEKREAGISGGMRKHWFVASLALHFLRIFCALNARDP
jgi:hypothetical protein